MISPEAVAAIQRFERNEKLSLSDIQTIVDGSEGLIDFDDVLPLAFKLEGKPMNVKKRRPMFCPMFKKNRKCRREMYMSARQVGKTAGASGSILTHANLRQDFNIMYVAPLALYVNRLHHQYMQKMMQTCMLPWKIQDKNCLNNVQEKTFTSGSHYYGVSCFNSAAQAIGLARIDLTAVDEVQDLDYELLPQILEVTGLSDFAWENYTGTARTIDNTIHTLWEQSSQNVWHMRCPHCGHLNVPTGDEVFRLIQPAGIGCSKCSTEARPRLLEVDNDRLCWWEPLYPEREANLEGFAGYHIPQIIVRDRIAPFDRYVKLYNKLHGIGAYSLSKFQNEVLGISSEQGGRPITKDQIAAASVLPRDHNTDDYSHIAGGADWGGSEIVSFTVGTLVGLHHTGKFHCLGATRPMGIQDNFRHLPVAAFMKNGGGDRLVGIGGDGGFVGGVQNPNLGAAAGVPCASILYGSKKTFFSPSGGRFNLFTVDRSTLIYITYAMIIEGHLLLPSNPEFDVFTQDLMAITAEDIETPSGTIRRYARIPSRADDFTHALGYALFICAIMSGRDLPSMIGLGAGASINQAVAHEIGLE